MIWMLGSPLVGLVSSVAKGATGIASGVAKGIGKAVSGADEKSKRVGSGSGKGEFGKATDFMDPKDPRYTGGDKKEEEETPELFGGLDLAKVKSVLDDEGPMGPPEPEAPTVYKRMIAVLKTMSETLLRMEATMKMLLSIEYERVKGMVAQSTAENITLAQTPDGDGGTDSEKRGLFGRGKDMLGGAWNKAKDSPTWLKMLGLVGLMAAIKFWKDDLEKAVAKILEWFTKAYEYFTADDFSWEKLKTDFSTKFLPKIKDFVFGILDWVKGAVKGFVTEWMFGSSGEKRIAQEANTGVTGRENMQRVISETSESAVEGWWKNEGGALSKPQRSTVYNSLKDALGAMKEISDQSDGRIQWTGIDRDLSKLAYFKIDTIPDLSNTLGQMLATPQMVLNSNPIIDGIESTWDVVRNLKPGDLAKMGGITQAMTEEKQEDITSALAQKSILANQKMSLENETWSDQGLWSKYFVNAGNEEGFELRKARKLAEIQAEIDAKDLKLEDLGQQIMTLEDSSGIVTTPTSDSGQKLKDAKKQTPTGVNAPFINASTNDNSTKTTVVNEGDTVALNNQNEYAIAAGLNEITGTNYMFGYG